MSTQAVPHTFVLILNILFQWYFFHYITAAWWSRHRKGHTWMTLAAPSVMASGQVYSPEEGEKRNNLLIWYTRLKYTHHNVSCAETEKMTLNERGIGTLITSTRQRISRNQWLPGLPGLTAPSCVSKQEMSRCGPLCTPRSQSAPAVED